MSTNSLPKGEESNSIITHKVHLTGEKATLLMPLYAKALDNRSKHPILHDEKADEIVRTIDFDFEKLKGFGNGNIMVVRAKQLDEWVKKFLKYLPLKYRLLFGIACVFPRYRNMIRLLRYEFNELKHGAPRSLLWQEF